MTRKLCAIRVLKFNVASTGRSTQCGDPAHEVGDCAWPCYVSDAPLIPVAYICGEID